MTKYIYMVFLPASFLLTGCVSSKLFKELQTNYDILQKDRERLADSLQGVISRNQKYQNDLKSLKDQYDTKDDEAKELAQELTALQNNLSTLQSSYDLLRKNKRSETLSYDAKNKELLKMIDEKQTTLNNERIRLNEVKQQLATAQSENEELDEKVTRYASELESLRYNMKKRSNEIKSLEDVISEKSKQMAALKENISAALLDFDKKGISVSHKNDKIYVTMEDKLLFNSGSWEIEPKGQKAVQQLAAILSKNPDIEILIEGHTDNVDFIPDGYIKDNWDLSVKRATAVVRLLLKNSKINPENITAAGKSEFGAIADNKTEEGKRKNRRIDVILTPKIDKILQIINAENGEVPTPAQK